MLEENIKQLQNEIAKADFLAGIARSNLSMSNSYNDRKLWRKNMQGHIDRADAMREELALILLTEPDQFIPALAAPKHRRVNFISRLFLLTGVQSNA